MSRRTVGVDPEALENRERALEKRYILEPHAFHWRLRRVGNKQGTMAGNRDELLAAARANGWAIEDPWKPVVDS